MWQTCPRCRNKLARIPRLEWMRWIPGSKHYMCSKCGYSFMLIFNRWLLPRHLHHLKSPPF